MTSRTPRTFHSRDDGRAAIGASTSCAVPDAPHGPADGRANGREVDRSPAPADVVVAEGLARASMTWTVVDGDLEIGISGDLCMVSAHRLTPAIIALIDRERPQTVTVDAGSVRFIDGRGVTLLVAVTRAAADLGAAVRVRSASAPVDRLLDLCGIRDLVRADVRHC